jgi:hypothetical protein
MIYNQIKKIVGSALADPQRLEGFSMSDNLEPGILKGLMEAIKAKPAITVAVLCIMVACGLLSLGLAMFIFLQAPITSTIIKKLPTNVPPVNQQGGFIPFKAGDCNAGGSFPAPDPGTMQIYPTNIYCPYTLSGYPVGTLFLSMQYVEDVDQSDYANMQDHWNTFLQSLDQMNGAENHSYLDEPPTQYVIVVVKDTEPGAKDMSADISDLILYKQHFIISISGGVTVNDELDAQSLENELIQYAETTAGKHYK